MDDPLFAEVKDEIKEEEPWGDHSHEVQAQGVNGGHYDQETEEKPNVDDLDKHYIGWNLPNKEPSGAVNSPAMQMAARATDLEQPKKYRIVYVNRQVIRKAMKRSFPGEADGEENLPNGKDQFSSWEKAAGAQHAEDILRENEEKEEFIVKEEDEKPPLSEDEPFVGALSFVFNCPACGTGFHIFKPLQSHVKDVHQLPDPLWCHLCPMKYRRLDYFWRHLKKEHGLTPNQSHPGGYKCDQCGGFFRLKEEYAIHCHFYRGRLHKYCQPCQRTVLPSDWENHTRTWQHRSVLIGVQRSAVQGSYNFGEKDTLSSEKHREKPLLGTPPEGVSIVWKCPVEECVAAFLTSGEMDQHMALHPGVVPFFCRHCPRRFWIDGDRNIHEKMKHPLLTRRPC